MKIAAKIHITSILVTGLLLTSCNGSTGNSNSSTTSTTSSKTKVQHIEAHGFPIPYAGTYYPIYNSGVGQWIEPTESMPFDKVSAIFVAFAHAYPQESGAILNFEEGQSAEPQNLASLVQISRNVNPQIKILISLGWEHSDWTYISNDYINNANSFVPSVIQFIRDNNLDGFDIDDESIGGSSGSITQKNFDGVIANLRQALNIASEEDHKPYYLTITPAGNNSEPGGIYGTQVSESNVSNFDLINSQTYYSSNWSDEFINALIGSDPKYPELNYPLNQIATGVITNENSCNSTFPLKSGSAGMFNWTMSSDSACSFQSTLQIATDVGY